MTKNKDIDIKNFRYLKIINEYQLKIE